MDVFLTSLHAGVAATGVAAQPPAPGPWYSTDTRCRRCPGRSRPAASDCSRTASVTPVSRGPVPREGQHEPAPLQQGRLLSFQPGRFKGRERRAGPAGGSGQPPFSVLSLRGPPPGRAGPSVPVRPPRKPWHSAVNRPRQGGCAAATSGPGPGWWPRGRGPPLRSWPPPPGHCLGGQSHHAHPCGSRDLGPRSRSHSPASLARSVAHSSGTSSWAGQPSPP